MNNIEIDTAVNEARNLRADMLSKLDKGKLRALSNIDDAKMQIFINMNIDIIIYKTRNTYNNKLISAVKYILHENGIKNYSDKLLIATLKQHRIYTEKYILTILFFVSLIFVVYPLYAFGYIFKSSFFLLLLEIFLASLAVALLLYILVWISDLKFHKRIDFMALHKEVKNDEDIS